MSFREVVREGERGKGGRRAPFFMRMPSAGSAEENPSMTKAVGPKHKPDLC